MNLVERAMKLVFKYQAQQVNQHDGEVYLLHLLRVATDVRLRGLDEIHQAVAWMHDLIEDTECTLAEVIAAFPDHPEIPAAIAVLTKPDDGSLSNREYYEMLLNFPIAARVKVSDLNDNFRRNHMIIDDEKRLRMAGKYSLGLDILSDFRLPEAA